jgi:hypothetical protein
MRNRVGFGEWAASRRKAPHLQAIPMVDEIIHHKGGIAA